MITSSTIIYNDRESGKYTAPANKAIIETHVATTGCYNSPDRIIENTTTRVKTEKLSKTTVT